MNLKVGGAHVWRDVRNFFVVYLHFLALCIFLLIAVIWYSRSPRAQPLVIVRVGGARDPVPYGVDATSRAVANE